MSTLAPGSPPRRSPSGEGRRRLFAVLAAGVVVAIVPAVLAALRDRDGAPGAMIAAGYDGPPPPVTRASDGSAVVVWGDGSAPLLEVFTDYRCAECKRVEDDLGPVIKGLASRGRLRVVYRAIEPPAEGGEPHPPGGGPPSAPLTPAASGPPVDPDGTGVRGDTGATGGPVDPGATGGLNEPPVPDESAGTPGAAAAGGAANAALCAPARNWYPYHEALFAHQPREGAPAPSPERLIALGARAGITGRAFAACVTRGTRTAFVEQLTRYAAEVRGVRSVPAAFLDGMPLDPSTHLRNRASFERAVHDARHG
ncbi:DsbA family protein [Spirillospora sp. CA-255316]